VFGRGKLIFPRNNKGVMGIPLFLPSPLQVLYPREHERDEPEIVRAKPRSTNPKP